MVHRSGCRYIAGMTRTAAMKLGRHLRAQGYRVAVLRREPVPGVRYWTVKHWIALRQGQHRDLSLRRGGAARVLK